MCNRYLMTTKEAGAGAQAKVEGLFGAGAAAM